MHQARMVYFYVGEAGSLSNALERGCTVSAEASAFAKAMADAVGEGIQANNDIK